MPSTLTTRLTRSRLPSAVRIFVNMMRPACRAASLPCSTERTLPSLPLPTHAGPAVLPDRNKSLPVCTEFTKLAAGAASGGEVMLSAALRPPTFPVKLPANKVENDRESPEHSPADFARDFLVAVSRQFRLRKGRKRHVHVVRTDLKALNPGNNGVAADIQLAGADSNRLHMRGEQMVLLSECVRYNQRRLQSCIQNKQGLTGLPAVHVNFRSYHGHSVMKYQRKALTCA